jgi:hypothetical protein
MATPTTSNVERPGALGFGCAFNENLFRIGTGFGQGLLIETAPAEAPRVDTASSPEEMVEDYGRVFARSSFEGGEGQFRAHTEDASPDRYWDSRGVSVSPAASGEFPEATLSHDTELLRASTATGIRVATDGESLWMTDGTTIFRTDDPTVASPAFVEDSPHLSEGAVAVTGLAVLGDELYAALGVNGIHVRGSGGTWTHYSDLAAVRVWAAQGRILASDGRSLYEIAASGAAPAATTTLPPGKVWTGAADAGAAILASATDGYVYAFTNESGTLVLAGQTEFPGEQPTAVGATRGVAAVGTRQGNIGRLWVGTLNEQTFTLQPLQLLREWLDDGSGVNRQPYAVLASRNALYTAVALSGKVDVWRYELSTQGLSRYLTVDAEGCTHGLVNIDGSVFASVCESGLYRESDLYVDSGYLIGPLGDFYSASDKSWVGARLDNGELNGARIELWYTTDPDALSDSTSTSWRRIISRTAGTSADEAPLTSVVARALAGMVKMFPDSTKTAAPTLRSFAFRAFSQSGDGDVIVTLPINISDRIERRGRIAGRSKGLGARTFSRLKDHEGRPVLLTLYRPAESVRGLVESVGVPVSQVNSRGSVTTLAVVRVRGRRVGSTGSVTGTGAFATRHLFATQPTFGAST